ncbi:hypothetical protein [Sphingopyxis flava]|uniref:Uncharacterized protein n=1 Tax=Sphingopyxis flava TaxID=1507287 RepID=A0A1T5DLE5_9SPHN|nr:hypothetical protein [Sphingopyxis flava]SKB72457.1 hypothetical protein SAMN06295937_101532 [Sphingopyxis flava]
MRLLSMPLISCSNSLVPTRRSAMGCCANGGLEERRISFAIKSKPMEVR